ncbi:hypothetical protein [Alteromonas sp. ASW11-130]|uniref:hypothetical protein n=1 Tax=Alteromonas sp. ASW11-130 TaxID=3015775 RepID=UPI002241D401|nr:hypothetical protein [Alteromonas sp. ASW11-130]MCW8093294.1 hypothetical protein [Alteromonas sp. ASW11-130]
MERFCESEQTPFAWEPEYAAVMGDGTTALSTGSVPRPDGTVFADYTSVWRNNAQDEWKITLDKGQQYCPTESLPNE